jgi:hypothetical protein
MKPASFTLSVLLCFFSASVAAEDFNNKSVVELTKAGIGEDVILAKIAGLPCSYDVSTSAIVALKADGVENVVIAAMVDRCSGAVKAQGAVSPTSEPTSKRKPGLYLDQDSNVTYRLEVMRPTSASGGRTTGNGSILFPFRIKLALPRASAQMIASETTPSFYFYFEEDDASVGSFGTSATYSAQSPSEFSLVKFKIKDGQREMNIGKQQVFSGGSIGIDPKDAIQFDIEELGDGIFRVSPQEALVPGEYGFALRSGSDAYRIYDFKIP